LIHPGRTDGIKADDGDRRSLERKSRRELRDGRRLAGARWTDEHQRTPTVTVRDREKLK
jgi:hypothetical protein